MPAAEPLPAVADFLRAYQGGLVSKRRHGDTHAGAIHDLWAGVGALLWTKIAARDREEWRALYFDGARGSRLDEYVQRRFRKQRRLLEKGQGTAQIQRQTTAGGAGVLWAGTRIVVGSESADPLRYYVVKQDVPVDAAALAVSSLPIEAEAEGEGAEIAVAAGDRPVLRFDDPLWDNTWQVVSLRCGPGSNREEDQDFRARVRTELFRDRFGYESAIVERMKAAGAETVALFRSDYLGAANDHGLNRVYVGDAGYETSSELLRDCRLAISSVAMAGASTQVLPVTSPFLTFSVAIRFWDSPEKFNMSQAREYAQAAVVGYFRTRQNPFVWDLAGVRAAVQRAVQDTQSVVVTASSPPPVLASLFNAYPLPRHQARESGVSVTLSGPA